jgi:hypothetical protein
MKINEAKALFNNACDVLKSAAKEMPGPPGNDCTSDAKGIAALMADWTDRRAFDSDQQAIEVHVAFTKWLLCTLALAVIEAELGESGGVINLSEVLKRHHATPPLIDLSKALLSGRSLDEYAFYELRSEVYAVVDQVTFSTAGRAWRAAHTAIINALNDPEILANDETVAFLAEMEEMARNAAGAMGVAQVMLPLQARMQSQAARQARNKRTDMGSAKVKTRALELYDASSWTTNAEAAKAIYPQLRNYVSTIPNAKYPSKERFAKTLGQWLIERKKNTANC